MKRLAAAMAAAAVFVSVVAAAPRLSVDQSAFNPSLGETVTVSYSLPKKSVVTVAVYDTDHGLVDVLADAVTQQVGEHEVVWDGKDLDGRVVPDEAYTFVVTSDSAFVIDPWTYSGGVVEDILDAEFDRAANAVHYELPVPARVLVRLGVENGPLYRTLVHWEPRVAGRITEAWNGYDKDRTVRLWDHLGFTALLTYVTLPEGSVITYGNSQSSYRDYKLRVAKDRPAKTRRPWQGPALQLRPAGLVPPGWAEPPQVSMEFLDGVSPDAAGDRLPVLIDVDESDRKSLLNDQFEIIMYVDDVFFGEAERGHVPFKWIWELHQFEPGEHRLTINISSSRGLIGVVSRRITLVR